MIIIIIQRENYGNYGNKVGSFQVVVTCGQDVLRANWKRAVYGFGLPHIYISTIFYVYLIQKIPTLSREI